MNSQVKQEKKKKKRSSSSKSSTAALSLHIPISSVNEAIERHNKNGSGNRSSSIPSFRTTDSPKFRIDGAPRGHSIPNSIYSPQKYHNGSTMSHFLGPSSTLGPKLPTVPEEPIKTDKYEKLAGKIELYFSKIIPALFLLFNIIYWPWLIVMADYYNEADFIATHYAE